MYFVLKIFLHSIHVKVSFSIIAVLECLFIKIFVCLFSNYSTLITSVVPGDYDGDSQMDVLLTYLPKNHANGELGAVIFWGQNQTLGEFVLNVFNICHWILKGKHAWYS